jgi:hypothetical protein
VSDDTGLGVSDTRMLATRYDWRKSERKEKGDLGATRKVEIILSKFIQRLGSLPAMHQLIFHCYTHARNATPAGSNLGQKYAHWARWAESNDEAQLSSGSGLRC